MPKTARHLRSRRCLRGARGVALIMVLSVVAAAALLAWAMLASSTMRSQVDDNAVDMAEAVSISESGVSYAMHCLHYPATVRPAAADAATWFYPGELGFKPWSDARGTADIVVTSTGTNKYKIRSTATVTRGSNMAAAKHTVEADVTVQLQGIVNAAGFNGGISVPLTTRIVGPVVASGTVDHFDTQVTGSPAVVAAATNVVPAESELALLTETGVASTVSGALSTDRTYTYNGNTYIAEKAPATITVLGLTTLRPSLNPCNVWWSSTNMTLNGATFNGVLVLRDEATLGVVGTCNVTAPTGMPALVLSNSLILQSSTFVNAKLYATGAVYVGEKVTAASPNKTTAVIKIDGALLMGKATPIIDAAAAIDITYKASAVNSVRHLSTIPTIAGVTIDRWVSTD